MDICEWNCLLFHIFFLSFLYPSFFLQKSVDRWTSKKISEKKHQSLIAWQSSAAKPDPIYGVEHHGQKTGSVGLGWPSGSKFRLGWGFFIRTYFWVEPASTPQPETFLFFVHTLKLWAMDRSTIQFWTLLVEVHSI